MLISDLQKVAKLAVAAKAWRTRAADEDVVLMTVTGVCGGDRFELVWNDDHGEFEISAR